MQTTESENRDIDIDFQQLWCIAKRRWLPAVAVFGSVVGLATLYTLLQKPFYEAEGKLLIKQADSSSSVTESGEEIGDLEALSNRGNPLDTEAEIIRSVPVVQSTIDSLSLKDKQGDPLEPKAFLKKLEVDEIGGTDILRVAYTSTIPQEAAAVVNQLTNLYLENNVLLNQDEAVKSREFIIRQLPKTEAAVHQAELALRQFKEENNVVSLQEEAESAETTITDLKNQVTQAQAQLGVANSRSEVLRNKLGMNSQEAVAASSLSQSAGVQKVLEEYQQVQGQLAVQRTRYQETHPVVTDLRAREAALKTLLQGRVGQVIEGQKQAPNKSLQIPELKQRFTENLVETEARRLGLAREVSTLSNALATYKQRAKTLPRLEQQQRQLERQLTAAQATYETLLQKLQEIRVTENQTIGNARIVQTALVPEDFLLKPIAVKLALAVLAGLLLAVTTILVLEVKDTVLKTVKEVRGRFSYTLLGIIPDFGSDRSNPRDRAEQTVPQLVVRDAPCSPISEAYRMVQANLKFLNAGEAPKVIVVTSSIPQEGKSTLSANLALAMAKPERRVLLVDADLRRPRQHRIWDLPNETGLSDVLVGQADFKVATQVVADNLYVLTAGAIPPNPVNLLDSKQMATLIEKFSDSYDFVIIDTPALCVAADTFILGTMSDGILLVTRPGVVDSASATAAKEMLVQSGLNILGLVVNGVLPKNEPYSYYHYAKEYYSEEASKTLQESNFKIGKHA